jgi:esterase/lipase
MNYFLSGWAIAPVNLNCEIIDSTKLVSKYKSIKNIVQNFDEIFLEDIETLTAWSMGAMIALGCLRKITAKKIILCSPALKFTANDKILEELNKLRQNIVKNKETAIKLFYHNCGFPKNLSNVTYYNTEELLDGLDFLKETEICEIIKPQNCEISIIYGENDKIISQNLSLKVAEKFGVEPIIIPKGNHFDALNHMIIQ